MRKYHKIRKLSTLLEFQKSFNKFMGCFRKEKKSRLLIESIAIVSAISLIFNFVFPHIAMASDKSKDSALSFNFSETISALPFYISENSILLAKIAENERKKIESNKARLLPVEQTIIVAMTLAKKITSEQEIVNIPEDENNKIAESICLSAGISDLPCWQDLKAMREKESYNGKAMVGDNGRSRGWYHIQTKMHRISVECAMDFRCSTEWTVKNLINNGYKTNRVYAISRHNGSGIMAQSYAKSVVYNSAKFE